MRDKSLRRPSVWDVARLARVSKSTVSRVVTDDPKVAPDTRARVHEAMALLGYQRDYRGRALRTGRTATIGFIVTDLRNPVYSTIAAAAQDRLFAGGYSLLLGAYGTDREQQYRTVEDFLNRGIEAIAVTTLREDDDRFHDLLETSGVAVGLLDRQVPSGSFDSVTCAHGPAMIEALEHLAESNHEYIVILDRPDTSYPGRESKRAADGFIESNKELDIRHLPTPMSPTHAFDAVLRTGLIKRKRCAVMATSNLLMVGALRALRVLDVKLGHDVSFIGTDDSPMSAVFEPPLTALSRDLAQMGEAVSELLLTRLKSDKPSPKPTNVHLPMRLVERGSVL